jgi:hypothetical protein
MPEPKTDKPKGPASCLIAWLLVLLLGASPAAAQQQSGLGWKQDDAVADTDPSRASKSGFGVLMLVTSDHEGFWKAWAGTTPPNVSTTDQVTRGRPVHAILLFSGCRPAADGECNVTMELAVSGPSGAAYGETMKAMVWSGPPAPAYKLQAAEGSLGFVLEPEDALGRYTLRAAVTDHVAGLTLPVQQTVEAVEAN